MNCTHPDHEASRTCEDRAVGCDKTCRCCMGAPVARVCAFCTGELPVHSVEDTPAWDGWCSTVCGVLGGGYDWLFLVNADHAAERRDEVRASHRKAIDTRGPLSEEEDERLRTVADAWEMARNVAVLHERDQDVEPLLEYVPKAILFGACHPNLGAVLHAILLAANGTDTAFVPPAVAGLLEGACLVTCDRSKYQRKNRTRLPVCLTVTGRLLAGIRPCTNGDGICADCDGAGQHLRYSHDWQPCGQCNSTGDCPCTHDATLNHGA